MEAGHGRDVILQADRATVEAVAARHGPAMVKWLKTGAVLRASADQLRALAADPAVGHLSGDTLVRSMTDVANQAIGADQARAGSLPGVGSVTGRGIGVALVDSGYSRHRALAGQFLASVDFTAVQRHRRRRAGPRHARRGPGRPATARSSRAWRRARGW